MKKNTSIILIILTVSLFGNCASGITLADRWTKSPSELAAIDRKIKINGAEFTYHFLSRRKDAIIITNYQSLNGSTIVVIPSTINGVQVERIGSYSFRNKGLTEVILEKNFEIEVGAFSDNEIQTITVLSSGFLSGLHRGTRSYVHGYAFANNQLESVNVSSGVPVGTFENNNITRVTFSGGLGSIEQGAFTGNPITEVVVRREITTIDPLEISGFGLVYITNGKRNGTYILQDDGWYYEGRKLATTFAELYCENGVIIEKIDGGDPRRYLSSGSVFLGTNVKYILPPGRHTIEARYEYNISRSEGSVNFNQVYLFDTGRYRITGTPVIVLADGTTINRYEFETNPTLFRSISLSGSESKILFEIKLVQ